jgi:hypothetical protein
MLVTINEQWLVKDSIEAKGIWACCFSERSAKREQKAIKRQEGYEPIIVHQKYDKPETVYFALIPYIQLKLGYF